MLLNILIVVMGLILIGAGVYAYVKAQKLYFCALLIFIGLAVTILSGSFTIVPTGRTGVRTTFGQVSEEVVHKGFNAKVPFVQSIKLVNTKQQDTTINEEIWGETIEKTPVIVTDVVVTYQINGERAAWIYSNVNDYDNNLISDSSVSSALKTAMIQFNAQDVTNRAKIEPASKEALQKSLDDKYGEDTVKIVKIVINQMDFEQSYNDAIAKKSIALQTQEEQKIANETAIAKAEADKQVAIAKAEASAETVRIAAEAQAEANNKISQSLNSNVLESKFYEKWNGALPSVMGDESVITDISGK